MNAKGRHHLFFTVSFFFRPERVQNDKSFEVQYFIVTSYIDKIDFSLYNKSLTDVATEVVEKIREENTTYYNEEETKILVKAEKTTKALNELPVGLRQSIFLNSYK